MFLTLDLNTVCVSEWMCWCVRLKLKMVWSYIVVRMNTAEEIFCLSLSCGGNYTTGESCLNSVCWLCECEWSVVCVNRFNCGTGPAQITSESSVVIGQWHTVTLFRNGMNGWLRLDNDTPVSGRSQVYLNTQHTWRSITAVWLFTMVNWCWSGSLKHDFLILKLHQYSINISVKVNKKLYFIFILFDLFYSYFIKLT